MASSNISHKSSKGRILRVKQGYNPNSSSMGSIVYTLPAALLAVTVGFGAVSSIILSAFLKNTDKKAKADESVPKDYEDSDHACK
jgi:hypothetical protein